MLGWLPTKNRGLDFKAGKLLAVAILRLNWNCIPRLRSARRKKVRETPKPVEMSATTPAVVEGAPAHGTLEHLLPPGFKRQIAAWLEEDAPSFDYGGFVVGNDVAEARLLGKSKVSQSHGQNRRQLIEHEAESNRA
jgi:hypothetical protein